MTDRVQIGDTLGHYRIIGEIGREFDEQFLLDLPPGVDPCGENGEFHSFVYEAPVFSRGIPVRNGEIVERDGFVFADVVPL